MLVVNQDVNSVYWKITKMEFLKANEQLLQNLGVVLNLWTYVGEGGFSFIQKLAGKAYHHAGNRL